VTVLGIAEVVRSVIAPVGAAFLTLSAMTLFAARFPSPRPPRSPRVGSGRDLRRFMRAFAVTALGGYVAFLAIIVVFSVGIVGDAGALRSAAWSGAFLIAVSAPVFAGVAAMPRRSGRR
jgi:hypothetical protein